MSNGNGNGTFHRPADGPVTSWAGPRPGVGAFNTHYGVDIGANFGWNVRAAWNGTVVRIYGSGNDRRLIIKHNGFLTSYLHNSRITVSVGQRVTAGQVIAKVGTAGTGPHLHWEYHPGSTWNGIYTASVDRANSWIRGTRNDASSNPSNRTTTAASTSTSSNTGATMSWNHRLKSHVSGKNITAGNMMRDAQRRASQAASRGSTILNRLANLPNRVWLRTRKSLVSGEDISLSNVAAWAQFHATEANTGTKQANAKIDALAQAVDDVLEGQGKIIKAVRDVEANVTIEGAEEVAKRLKITVAEVEDEEQKD